MPSCYKRLQLIVDLSQPRTDMDNICNLSTKLSGNKELKPKKKHGSISDLINEVTTKLFIEKPRLNQVC